MSPVAFVSTTRPVEGQVQGLQVVDFLKDDADSASDFDCDPSCKTCRGYFANPIWCLTCADGSDVKIVLDNFGFCGEPCPLCYDDLVPEEPGNTYWAGWPHETRGTCSADFVESPIIGQLPAADDACSWLQKMTYLQCDCPKLPPLPVPSTVDDTEGKAPEKCPICADGTDPTKPDATLVFKGAANTSCSRLANAFAYPGLGMLGPGDSYLTRDSLECTMQQSYYYEECGCPKPEVNKNACTLCYDGAPVKAEYVNVTVTGRDFYLGDSQTCGEIEDEIPWEGHEKGSWYCENVYNDMGANECGCVPVPTLAPTPSPANSAIITKNLGWVSFIIGSCVGTIVWVLY